MFAVGEAKVKEGVKAPQFDGFEAPLVLSSTSCHLACRSTVVYVNEKEINYEMIEKGCSSNYKGKEIEVFLLKIIKKKEKDDKLHQHTMQLLFVYRPPLVSLDNLNSVIKDIHDNHLKNCAFLIIGDFNEDIITNPDYNPLTAGAQDKIEFAMPKDEKTFVHQGEGSALIDHIWASKRVNDSYNHNARRKENTPGGQSYHYIIAITLTRKG